METTIIENMSFKETVEELLQNDHEVIFMKNDNIIGEVTKYTPYKVVNLFEKIYSNVTKIEVTYIGNRVYIRVD